MQNITRTSQTMKNSGFATDPGMKLVKGLVTDLDVGHITASVQVLSGKRVISLVIAASEVPIIGIEQGREIFCLIEGRDITLFRDAREFFKAQGKTNPVTDTIITI